MSDEIATIRVSGLAPDSDVVVRGHLVDGDGKTWASEMEYKADTDGVVDLSKQAPLKGSYKTISAMGLLWSMKPSSGEVHAYQVPRSDEGEQAIDVSVVSSGKEIASGRLLEMFQSPTVHRVKVDGLVHGVLFEPSDAGPHPAVLVLGGSEGGVPRAKSMWLARHGYAALALAYFHYEDLPPLLESIPLEYFGRALAWLMQRPEVVPTEVGVMGTSRGGELALQLGALYPQIRAVVAYVPANVRYPSCCGRDIRAAWTLGGRSLAYVAARDPKPIDRMAAEIPVENTKGPILVLSAEDDGMWPSSRMTAQIEQRLKFKRFGYPFVRLDYEHAGHRAGFPVIMPEFTEGATQPLSGRLVEMGGTAEGNAVSSLDAIPKVLGFLQQYLPEHAGAGTVEPAASH